MATPEQIEAGLERILLKVQKPGRYVGGELNTVIKDWDRIDTRIALVFPDIYDIGISNLGLQILYDLVNQRPDALNAPMLPGWIWKNRCACMPSRFTRWRQNMPWLIMISWAFPCRMKPSIPMRSICLTWPIFRYGLNSAARRIH